jgi:ATPase subunit of ABC transporter with duplicated ATPase domains
VTAPVAYGRHGGDRIYADSQAMVADDMHAAEPESRFAEHGGCTAEPRAGSILIDAGIEEWRHNLTMREVPPGLKLRLLLAQVRFSRPGVLLLDEPTNHMDMETIESLQTGLAS